MAGTVHMHCLFPRCRMLTRCVTHVRLLHCQVTKLPESGGGSGPQEKQNFGVGILFFQVRRTVAIVFRAQSAQINYSVPRKGNAQSGTQNL